MSPTESAIEFIRLSDMPDLAVKCAQFHASVTTDASEDGLEMRSAAFQRLSLDGEEEDAIVAVRAEGDLAGKIIGLAVLVKSELDAFEELGPWFAGLAVESKCAATSLPDQIREEIESLADELGYAHICLHSSEPGQFLGKGYEKIEPFERDGKEHWVLGKTL